MKRYWLVLLPLALCSSLFATEWQPPDEFLKAVRFVESSNGKFVVGDNGQSLGDFQISEAAWLDVNAWRKARRLKTYSYTAHVYHRFINKVYASNYLTMLHTELSRKLSRPPTPSELYAAYNLGLGTFSQLDFQMHRVNSVTRAKCAQIGEMMASR